MPIVRDSKNRSVRQEAEEGSRCEHCNNRGEAEHGVALGLCDVRVIGALSHVTTSGTRWSRRLCGLLGELGSERLGRIRGRPARC